MILRWYFCEEGCNGSYVFRKDRDRDTQKRGILMNIALIANDAKKELMTQFCIAYCGTLSKHNL